jgi:hypothetical protein
MLAAIAALAALLLLLLDRPMRAALERRSGGGDI